MSITLDKPAPESGYTHCACRDCMDLAISNEVDTGPEDNPSYAYCWACEEAGCTPDVECQRDDAYGEC